MKIHTKTLDGGGTLNGTRNAIFAYGKEVLGSAWTFTTNKLVFTDPTGSGDQGWFFVNENSEPHIISNGLDIALKQDDIWHTSDMFTNFIGLVWEGNSGSVGLGYVAANSGEYKTWYTLIKIHGQYGGKDIYSVSCGQATSDVNTGKIMIHGNIDIGAINHAANVEVGSGVYLHALYDPVTGFASSDVFGVQSMDSSIYAHSGTIVKQGTTSYMSFLGGPRNAKNTLFVKM